MPCPHCKITIIKRNKGDGNPHAHILLTMRAMDEKGKLRISEFCGLTLRDVDLEILYI